MVTNTRVGVLLDDEQQLFNTAIVISVSS